MSMKNPLTPAGIALATFRFVAQHLNHCATAVPKLGTGNVKILRQLVVKYNAVKLFIVQCNVSINLKEPIISSHFI